MKTRAAGCAAWALGAAGLLALGACSKKKQLNFEESCNERFDALHAKFEKKKYYDIKDDLSELITSCPGSKFTEQALFELGESYYHLEDWTEAQSEYGSFVKEFPNSKRYGELARFRLAEVSAKQVRIPQRDQAPTLTAIDNFQAFLAAYPDSKLADSANAELGRLRKQLATKELQTARFYYRMDEPEAAAIYYKGALKDYGSYIDQREVNLDLARCYIRLEQFDEAGSYLGKFDGIARDDPFRAKVKAAYADLERARKRYDQRKRKEAKAKEGEAL